MKTKRFLWRSALLASAAVGPLLVSHESMAQGAPGAGSFPGSFLVPGTQTSFKIGGYVKFDYTYDFGAQQINGFGTGVPALVTPFGPLDGDAVLRIDGHSINVQPDAAHHIHGNSQFTAAESRFNIETRTPTAYGELKTYIEGDFSNPTGLANGAGFKEFTNSSGFRLRQAYGALGPFLAGQTFDLFRDAAAEAEELDFGGDNTTGRTRTPQARYTFDFGNGLTWAVDGQNPQTAVIDGRAKAVAGCLPGATVGDGACVGSVNNGSLTTFGSRQGDKIPDFATAVQYQAPWGHLRASAVFRDLYWHQGTDGTNNNLSTFGYAVSLTGGFNVPIGKDAISWEIAYGDGGGAFIASDVAGAPDAVWTAGKSRTLDTIESGLVFGGYTHFWNDTLRSNVAGSYFEQRNRASDFVDPTSLATRERGEFNFQNQQKSAYTAHVNLIWSPVPQTNFGIEYVRVHGKLEDGQTSSASRFQASAQFRF